VSDKKITELNNITSANLSDVDEFVVVDISGDETKAITYGELKQFNGAISSDGLTVNGDITATGGDLNLDTLDLNAIAATKAVTAVDVFVYDTSKDSDGGAWRKRTQGTSWYNETLNTATRGSRKEFPAVAVIVAEADTVTIYDGDDPSLPMWMVANRFSGSGYSWIGFNTTSTAKAVSMLNGVLCVGSTDSASNFRPGLAVIDFGADSAVLILEPADPKDLKTISERNVGANLAKLNDVRRLVNSYVRDVAMTVLPDAPIDSATGLPVPTIAVATDGGVSVIKDDGTVVDSAATTAITSVIFCEAGLYYISVSYNAFYFSTIADALSGDGFGDNVGSPNPSVLGVLMPTWGSKLNTTVDNDFSIAGSSLANSSVKNGLMLHSANVSNFDVGMSALLTSTYNTGWMNGDIKGAFLSDTDDTDLVGGTDNDRSVKVNPLTVNGTVTRTAVATGADLVAYSGFSASNYLEQPYNSDLDFGTSDFCVMGWASFTSTGSQVLLSRTAISGGSRTGAGFQISNSSDSFIFDITDDGYASFDRAEVPFANNTGVMQHICCLRSGSNTYIYVNGVLAVTKAISNAAGSLSNATATLTVGAYPAGTVIGQFPWSGSLALLRISATAPTAEQIAKIYNDEKVLFQENAQATLYGTSDAVTALAHDDATDLLHVGTSAGRSVFQGLRRVSNTTTAVGTAISASNGLVVEE